MTSTQPSQLLGALFESVSEERPLTVLDAGPAVQETVDFLSRYRCRLHVLDLFSDLPIEADDEGGISLQDRFQELLQFPRGTLFDICLFWDLFNYLGEEGVRLLGEQLRPHIAAHTLGHAFGAHNPRSPQRDCTFSIIAPDTLQVRDRPARLRGYAPLPQSRLQAALGCFTTKRSVLLSDGRLELLLAGRAQLA